MNITFLIGNGFDLRMGMKTRFTDMYEGYIAQDSATDAIRKFKKMLEADAPNYKTWGDFEMAMAQKANLFFEEFEFIECLRDFKLYMVEHLRKEQDFFFGRKQISEEAHTYCRDEFAKSIEHFYVGLSPNTINTFIDLGLKSKQNYQFVSFNYTTVFDNFIKTTDAWWGGCDVLHIHGSLDADIVLGADNLDQISKLPYMTTRRFERAFIKPQFNKSFDANRLSWAEQAIDNSDIICIYGMSLGRSDYSWTKRLKEWLLSSPDNHLVYFVYDNRKFNKQNWDEIMDEEDDRIATLLGRICDASEEMSKLFGQIHIPVVYDLFGIDEILTNEKLKVDEANTRKEEILKRLAGRPQELGISGR